MSEIFEPENQFLERLEWQLSSEFRRTDRLKSTPEKIGVSRRMVAVSAMIGILMTGVAMIKATEVIRDNWRKKIEIARIETAVSIKAGHLESAKQIADRVELQYASGLISEEQHKEMQRAVEKADLDLQRSKINLEEVKVSGNIPRDELYAPLVRGRDFVSERLKLDISDLELDLGLARSHFSRIKQKVDAGVMHERELEYLQSAIDTQDMGLENIQKKLDLRDRFLNGEITAQEIEIEDRLTQAEKNYWMAQEKVDTLNKQMERLKNLVSNGMVDSIELTQMQYVLNAAQAELDLAALELDVLRKIK